jgi:hypothetical protein
VGLRRWGINGYLNERGVENLKAIAREVRTTGIADEIWLVLECTSVSDVEILSTVGEIKVLIIKSLDSKLAAVLAPI